MNSGRREKPYHLAQFWNVSGEAKLFWYKYPSQTWGMLSIKCFQEALSLCYILTFHLKTLLLLHFGSLSSLVFAALPHPNPPIETVKRGCGFYYPSIKQTPDLKKLSLMATLFSLLPWYGKWGISFPTMVWRLYKYISHNTKHQLYVDANIFF